MHGHVHTRATVKVALQNLQYSSALVITITVLLTTKKVMSLTVVVYVGVDDVAVHINLVKNVQVGLVHAEPAHLLATSHNTYACGSTASIKVLKTLGGVIFMLPYIVCNLALRCEKPLLQTIIQAIYRDTIHSLNGTTTTARVPTSRYYINSD